MLFERSEFIECFEKIGFRPLSTGRFCTFLFDSLSFGDERKRILLLVLFKKDIFLKERKKLHFVVKLLK